MSQEQSRSQNPSHLPPQQRTSQSAVGETTVASLAAQLARLELSLTQEVSRRQGLECELEQIRRSSEGSNTPRDSTNFLRSIRDTIAEGMANRNEGGAMREHRELQERTKTLASLITSAPTFDGSGDILLWKRRMCDFFARRGVNEELMRVDVIQDSCKKEASAFLGTISPAPGSEDELWKLLLGRFEVDTYSRLGDFEKATQKSNQTYRQYADTLQAKAYGLNLPLEFQLRHYLKTMRNSSQLRRFLLPNLGQYSSLKELAAAVDHLTTDDPSAVQPQRCRECGREGHLQKDCPRRRRRQQAGSGRQRANAEAVQNEPDQDEAQADAASEELSEEDCEDAESLSSQSIDMAVAEPAEKRPLTQQHQDAVKRLRSDERPAPRASHPAGPEAGPSSPTPLFPVPIRRSADKGKQPQHATTQAPQRQTASFPHYHAPRAVVKESGSSAKPRSLRRAMQEKVDVPADLFVGLILNASQGPDKLARKWTNKARTEAQQLTNDEPSAEVIEIELGTADEFSVEEAAAVLNPLGAPGKSHAVGYIPIKFPQAPDITLWAMVDTGAAVSVISAGLAAWLGLIKDDNSNISPSPFTVSGYNGSKSYMPLLTTRLRFGAKGGEERAATLQLCMLDTNNYKLLIGVDILRVLRFVYNDPEKRLHLVNGTAKFSLPIVDKSYAFRSRSIREYLAALPCATRAATEVEIDTTETVDLSETLAAAKEEQRLNLLDAGARQIADEDHLQELLVLNEIQQLDPTYLEPEQEVVGSLSVGLVSQLAPEAKPKCGQTLLVMEAIGDGDARKMLKVANRPLGPDMPHFVTTGEHLPSALSYAIPNKGVGAFKAIMDISMRCLGVGEHESLVDIDEGNRLLAQASPDSTCTAEGEGQLTTQVPTVSVEAASISTAQFKQTDDLLTVFSGPMFAGKTTALIGAVNELRRVGRRVKVVKAKLDDRYSTCCIRAQNGTALEADIVVSCLDEVSLDDCKVIAVEELNFFPDATATIRHWLDSWKVAIATTLETGALGEPFPVWGQLEKALVPVNKVTLVADCDKCLRQGAGVLTARTTPVSTSWVGGKDKYATCCPGCFQIASVFHNPCLTLADPNWENSEATLTALVDGGRESLCAAAIAMIETLKAGHTAVVLRCDHCSAIHLDQLDLAVRPHRTRFCHACEKEWKHPERSISNPLAAYGPEVMPEGKLRLTLPSVKETLPTTGAVGNMGTAALPSEEKEKVLSARELVDFLAEHGLQACGPKATLPRRAWKLKVALKDNPLLVSASLTQGERQDALQMLLEVADVFAMSIEDLTTPAKGMPFQIDTGGSPPIKQRPFRLGRLEMNFLDKTIASQRRGGIVKPSTSSWSSPTFVAWQRVHAENAPPKPRKVIDYRRLNAITRVDTYPLPDIQELLEWLSAYAFFGAVDLKSGYWQKPVASKDQAKTAFVTPTSLYEYTRVPLGLRNAPPYFMREVNLMLEQFGLKTSRGFIDDLLTGGNSWQDYLNNQRLLLLACRDHGLLVTTSKLRVGYTRITALGHVVESGVIRPDPDKVGAIHRLSAPKDVKGIRAVLGLVGYYRSFIKDFAFKAKPLTQLLKQDIPFEWGEAQARALEGLKGALSDATLRHAPTPTGRYRLYTDWSKDAMGACLHQIQEGREVPIHFASRLCRGPEQNLSSAEGELCAAIYGLGKFRAYVGFGEFDLFTDSAALRTLRTNQNMSNKLARWAMLLTEFNFTIHHKPGTSIKNADGLTRSSQRDSSEQGGYIQIWELIQGESFLSGEEISCAAQPDPNPQLAIIELNALRKDQNDAQSCSICDQALTASRVHTCGRCGKAQHARCTHPAHRYGYWYCPTCRDRIQQKGPADITEDLAAQAFLAGGPQPPNWTEEQANQAKVNYQWCRGHLLISLPEGQKVYPTAFEREQILELTHIQLAHAGWPKTAQAIAEKYFWPSLQADAKRHCQQCLPCQLQTSVFRRRNEVGGNLAAEAPRIAWSLDCAPAINAPDGTRKSVLIAVDDFSRFTLLTVLGNLSSASVTQAFVERILSVYGKPRRIRTDQGREFLGEFRSLLVALKIEHIQTRPVSPWTNGRAERMVRTVKSCMKRLLAARASRNWPELIPWIMAAINSTVSRSVGYALHEIFYGEPPSPLVPGTELPPTSFNLGDGPVEDYVHAIKQRLAFVQAEAARQQRMAAQGVARDYGQTPIAGRQYARESQFARTQAHPQYTPGQLVMVKRPKVGHFDLGAAGPYFVEEDLGQSLRVLSWFGRRSLQNKANCLPLHTGVELQDDDD